MKINNDLINTHLHTKNNICHGEIKEADSAVDIYHKTKEYALEKLTPEQKISLEEYTSTSYTDINCYLNEKKGDSPFIDDIKNIDNAITTAGEFTGVVYRGCTRVADTIIIGDLVTSPTFLSTSINEKDALRFDKGVMITFHITEKGTALPVGCDYADDEYEVLLARSLVFKVDAKISEEMRITLILKQVPINEINSQQIKDYRTGTEIIDV